VEYYIDSPIRIIMGARPRYKDFYRRIICNYTRPPDDVSKDFTAFKMDDIKSLDKPPKAGVLGGVTPARRGLRGTLVPL
jgi:hypothetical protein